MNCFECGVCIEDWKDSSIPKTAHLILAVHDNIQQHIVLQAIVIYLLVCQILVPPVYEICRRGI